MDNHFAVARAGLVASIISSTALSAAAPQTTALVPNLRPFPASGLSLVSNGSQLTLRFATTSWNNGAGPLEIVARGTLFENGTLKQQVDQRIYNSDGSYADRPAGTVTYHAEHNHIHFDDYALYTLEPIEALGASQRTGSKITFCIMDTTRVDTRLPGAPGSAVYTTCGRTVQGMSVGWGDTYGAHLPGQEIDFTNSPGGIYQLKIDVDPKKLLTESDETDNLSCVLLDIRPPSTVTVLDASGSCSTVTSISPNSAPMGTTTSVTILGHGFAQGMGVTFESGNGPRPVASNIVVFDNAAPTPDRIEANVTVAKKKQLGRDPVWSVRVGSGGLLQDAFTVTR